MEFEEQARRAQVENRKKGAESAVRRSWVGLSIFTHAGQFSKWKVDPTDESALQATLWEAKVEVGIIRP